MMRRDWSEGERWWLFGGGALVLVILFAVLVVLPYLRKVEALDKRIARAASQIEALEALQPEVIRLRATLGRAPQSSRTTSVTTLVENSAASLDLRERLVALRPAPVAEQGEVAESLEVEIEKVELEELVRWLYAIERAPGGAHARDLRLRKRFDDPERFNVTLQLVRYRTGGAR